MSRRKGGEEVKWDILIWLALPMAVVAQWLAFLWAWRGLMRLAWEWMDRTVGKM